MALEFAQIEYRKRQVHGKTIFSDSLLGLVNFLSQKDCRRHKKIDLEKSGLEVSIKWTPGHAAIRGNCIADELAKEAAEEAKLTPEDGQILTGAELKKIARVSCCMKWQRSLDASDTGRTLYDYKPTFSLKTPAYMFVPFIEEKKVISQLRLVYTLNEYRYIIGVQEPPLCSCGAIETVDH